ncbi:MAG: thioesterase family protein [Gemmatales bacterium]|nr:acyl-CoA thioesterase [Gemmatales bacterium]MCS7159785.1 acyl-CoA thioesterase [Gemmatales bacterium]MDW8174983.1 thioesterase family protein [Gemmatales bacterium]MDW8223138.1 thioesterase family protein [Gemmatales bacterium]
MKRPVAESGGVPLTFEMQRRVEFADTDLAGVVHFTRFFQYMEEAEHAFLRSRGLSVVMRWHGQQLGWPRVAAECEYFRPAFFEDVLTLRLTLTKVGRKSLTYTTEFYRGEELLARGQITTCCCIMLPDGRMSPIELPEELRQRLLAP